MKKSAQSSTPVSVSKGPSLVSVIGILGIIISIVLALVVIGMSSLTPKRSAPTVIFTGDYQSFPTRSMYNTLHAAGFNVEISRDEPRIKENSIVVAVGESSFDYVNAYRDNDDVKGIVLVCPAFPEGSKVNGMNAQNPSKDIAIFAGKDSAKEVAYISDARLIYERLSGDDTVYGTPIKRGGLFSSRNYVNNGQNRMLSLGAFKVNSAEELLFSPLFQNELAGYLSNSFSDNKDASYVRINAYFVLTAISIVLAAFSLLLVMAGVSVNTSRYKVPGSCYGIAITSGLVVTAGLIVGALIPRVSAIASNGITVGSCVMLAVFSIVVDFYFATKRFGRNETASARKGNKILNMVNNIVLSLAPVVLVFEYLIILADMSCKNLALVFVFAVVDFLAFTVLAYLGGKMVEISQLMAVISSIVILVVGMISKHTDIVSCAKVMFTTSILTFVVSYPSAKHSTNPFFSGVTHSVITLLFLIALL